jgi:hypothetical protein
VTVGGHTACIALLTVTTATATAQAEAEAAKVEHEDIESAQEVVKNLKVQKRILTLIQACLAGSRERVSE